MAHGGKRPGAGRPKGSKDPHTLAKEAAIREYAKSEALTAKRVLEELRRLAFADVGVLFDPNGNLRPLHELTREQRASIAGMEVIVKNAQAGDGHTDTVHKIKTWDKVRSLEALAKHFGLLTEKMEHSGEFRVIHELAD